MDNNNDRVFFCNMKDLNRGRVKAWFRERVNDAVTFYNNNKEFVIMVGIPVVTGIIGLGKAGIRAADRSHRDRVDRHNREMRFYDPSLKCWWQLKHPLSNVEKVMISKRRANGEKVSTILHDMNLV